MTEPTLQQHVQQVFEDGKASFHKLIDQAKTGNVEQNEVLFASYAYLGIFGILGAILPSLGTTAYGGDATGFADDWCKSACTANLALALLAFVAQRWLKASVSVPALRDVHRVLFAGFALQAISNLFIVLYGSLGILCVVNAAIDGVIAFFHFRFGDVLALVSKKSP